MQDPAPRCWNEDHVVVKVENGNVNGVVFKQVGVLAAVETPKPATLVGFLCSVYLLELEGTRKE